MCKSIVPDAITQLQNGTVVVFEGKNLWFLTLSEESQPIELSGPCPINQIFEGVDGPIDAAVTIETHESVTEFRGASIYFSNGSFYTFKNLRPYQVEWGDIIYLPVKGLQSTMGVTVDEAKRLMPTKMAAAFFDPNSSKTKFIFADLTVLGYTFELGSQFDKPVVTDLSKELKKFGIPILPKNITAALTLMKSKEFVFFQGSKYCIISFELSDLSNQSCYNQPISRFFNCHNITENGDICAQTTTQTPTLSDKPEPQFTIKESEENGVSEPAIPRRPGVINNMNTKSVDIVHSKKPTAQTAQKASAQCLPFSNVCRIIEIFVILLYIQRYIL